MSSSNATNLEISLFRISSSGADCCDGMDIDDDNGVDDDDDDDNDGDGDID